jgi:Bacterial SH3 domain/PEGA domain
MQRKLLVILTAVILLSGCNLSMKKSGVEILSYPTAKVYLDGKEAGMTPYKNNSLTPGDVSLKLSTGTTDWTKEIHLENGANTVVDREFGNTDDESGGYILYFESTGDSKKAGLMVSSNPSEAAVYTDDDIKGYSPIRIDDAGEGDKKLTVSYPGYKSISSFVKLVAGYQLVVEADLAKEETTITPDAGTTGLEVSSSSAQLQTGTMITIKDTETGWLRVRASADSNGAEITTVKPGEKYKMISEVTNWYLIDLGVGKSGWVSAKYAEKGTTN